VGRLQHNVGTKYQHKSSA